MCVLSHDQLFAASQAPVSMKFSREEYRSRLLFPSPGDLPDTGIKPTALPPPALAGFFTIVPLQSPYTLVNTYIDLFRQLIGIRSNKTQVTVNASGAHILVSHAILQ